MTFEEQEAHANELFDKVAEIVKQHVSTDMSADKVVARMAVVGQLGGVTRTTALGAALFAGVYGCLTGLTKSQILGMVGDLFDVVDANPASAEAKEAYAKANANFKAKAATQSASATEHGFSDLGVILAPMPKLKQ